MGINGVSDTLGAVQGILIRTPNALLKFTHIFGPSR